MNTTTTPAARLLISLDEAAERLSVSRSTVQRMVKRSDLRSVRIGSRSLIDSRSITEYIEGADNS